MTTASHHRCCSHRNQPLFSLWCGRAEALGPARPAFSPGLRSLGRTDLDRAPEQRVQELAPWTQEGGGGLGAGRRGPPPPWPSAILSPCRLLHQHQVLSSHGSGMWGFERRVQRPGFWSWPCRLAQGTSSHWTSASSSVEWTGANVGDQISSPHPRLQPHCPSCSFFV